MNNERLKDLLESFGRAKEIPGDMAPSEQRRFIECGLAEVLGRVSGAYDIVPNWEASVINNGVNVIDLTEKGKMKLEIMREP